MKNPIKWLGKQIASIFTNRKKIAQNAINIINVLKSIVESPLAHTVDELITGNDNLVQDADKWLTEALNAAEFVSGNTVKTAISQAVQNLIPMVKMDRGSVYNSIGGYMLSTKTGENIEVAENYIEKVYQEGK